MRQDIELRVVSIAHAMVFSGATVRALAREYGVSKSTVHKDVAKRLRTLDPDLYAQVQAILIKNKSERHIRGGMATKLRAAQMATAAGCEMVIANGQSPEVLYDVAAGKRVGTRFLAKRDEA